MSKVVKNVRFGLDYLGVRADMTIFVDDNDDLLVANPNHRHSDMEEEEYSTDEEDGRSDMSR